VPGRGAVRGSGANTLIGGLCEISLLDEITGGRRNRMFRFTGYVDLFADSEVDADAAEPEQGVEREATLYQ
jgi:hypothetical protein